MQKKIKQVVIKAIIMLYKGTHCSRVETYPEMKLVTVA